ncbi:hypothetical protein GEMRC1_009647 [Eukaryota sp. GEM-RC1]
MDHLSSSEPTRSSCNPRVGEEPHISTLRPNHEQYELPSETPFTAKIVNVAYSATEADIRQAFSSLPVKKVRSPSNIPGTFFVQFLDVQGLKQCLDEYWMFEIHGRPIRTYVASTPRYSVKPLNSSTFSSKPNTEPKPRELLPLTSSFQSPLRYLHFQQSLLVLINVHLLRIICKSSLELNNYMFHHHFLNYRNLTKNIGKFFKKVGYTSDGFFEAALLATKVFFQTNTFNVVSKELPKLFSFTSFFGAEVQSVFLGVCESCNVEEFQSYSHVISGLELRLWYRSHVEFLNKSSLCFPRLKELHVDVSSSQALHFIDLLKVNETVTRVHLRDSYIGGEDVRALAEALKVNTTVTSLDLSGNSIGEEGVRALSEALKVNTTLISLDLGGNSIEDEGVRALAEALKVNTAITSIDLGFNSVGDEGARALADALKVNAILTSISVDENAIGAEGARALSEALKVNSIVKIVL